MTPSSLTLQDLRARRVRDLVAQAPGQLDTDAVVAKLASLGFRRAIAAGAIVWAIEDGLVHADLVGQLHPAG